MRGLILCLTASVLTAAAIGVSAQGRLPPCPGSFNADAWTNCVATFTYPDGSTYVGEFKDVKPNGHGASTFPDGKKYVGEWKDSKYNGRGTEYRADGSILRSGIWENGSFVRKQ